MHPYHTQKKLVTVFSEKTEIAKNPTTSSQDIVQTRKCHANADANANVICTKINMVGGDIKRLLEKTTNVNVPVSNGTQPIPF